MLGTLRKSIREIVDALEIAGQSVSDESGKSRLRQGAEMLRLKRRGYTPDDYYTLRLHATDPASKSGYLNHRMFTKVRQRLNPRHIGVVPFNKWVFCIYFEELGIPVPRCHGIFHGSRGLDRQGNALSTMSDLQALLGKLKADIVIKPLDESHGNGVMVISTFDLATGQVRRVSGSQQSLRDLYQTLSDNSGGWVIQDRIVQHDVLAELHPVSVNTARVITSTDRNGRVSVIGAVLRIGVGASEIDNTTGGGIVAPVNLADGVVGAAYSRFRVSTHVVHPETGVAIRGLQIPHWDEVMTVVTRAHKFLPFPRTLGWDVAVGANGPVLLEVNSDYYYNHLQLEGPSAAVDELRNA